MKKLIYLDQFAISNMAKALDKRLAHHERTAQDGFWLRLFEAIERVVNLQIAICPYSMAHRDESLLSGIYFDSYERMYRQLSYNVGFRSFDHILHSQVGVAASAWIQGKTSEFNLDPQRVTDSGLHEWQPPYIIAVNRRYFEDEIDAKRRSREKVHLEVGDVFEYYQKGPKDFDHWFAHETRMGAEGILKGYARDARRWMEQAKTGEILDLAENQTHATHRVRVIINVFEARGVSTSEMLKKVAEFLFSDAHAAVPASHRNRDVGRACHLGCKWEARSSERGDDDRHWSHFSFATVR